MNECVCMLINVVVLNHMYVCLYERLLGLSTSAGSVNVCMGEDDKQVELRFRILSAIQNIFYDHTGSAQNDSFGDDESSHKKTRHVPYNLKVGQVGHCCTNKS